MSQGWNHNIYYHDFILQSVPKPCFYALDIGCGDGLLSRKLAPLCSSVTGIDLDKAILFAAKNHPNKPENINYLEGDVTRYPFKESTFNLITIVATLHHLPLRTAILHLQELLAPGGVLVVIGLYKPKGVKDFIRFAAAFLVSWLMRFFYAYQKMEAPVKQPEETLSEIKNTVTALLPAAVFKQHFFYRYSFTWHKPK